MKSLKSMGFVKVYIVSDHENLYEKYGFKVIDRKLLHGELRKRFMCRDYNKTLIFNGSPRKNGDTVQAINYLTALINGEYKIIDTYDCNISPCADCRWCRANNGCYIDDEMQDIYKYIQECDNIIVASPIYFSELTGKLLDVGSGLQTYFSARYFRNKNPISRPKKGAVVLVGGGDGNMDKAYDTACTLLKHMNVIDVFPAVCSHNTNIKSALEDAMFTNKIAKLAAFF